MAEFIGLLMGKLSMNGYPGLAREMDPSIISRLSYDFSECYSLDGFIRAVFNPQAAINVQDGSKAYHKIKNMLKDNSLTRPYLEIRFHRGAAIDVVPSSKALEFAILADTVMNGNEEVRNVLGVLVLSEDSEKYPLGVPYKNWNSLGKLIYSLLGDEEGKDAGKVRNAIYGSSVLAKYLVEFRKEAPRNGTNSEFMEGRARHRTEFYVHDSKVPEFRENVVALLKNNYPSLARKVIGWQNR